MIDELLSRARLHACAAYPYLAPAFWSVRLIAVAGLDEVALATPSGVIIFSEECLKRVSLNDVPLIATVLYHEVSHIIRRHSERRGSRDELF